MAAALAASSAGTANAVFLFNDSANSNTLILVHTTDLNNDGMENNLATFFNNTTPVQTQNLDAGDFVIV